MHDYEQSIYTRQIRITKEDLEWIKENKGKKSAAGFLEQIINKAKQYDKCPRKKI